MSLRPTEMVVSGGRVWRADEVAVVAVQRPHAATAGLWPWSGKPDAGNAKTDPLSEDELAMQQALQRSPLIDGVSLYMYLVKSGDGTFEFRIQGFKLKAHRYAVKFANALLSNLEENKKFTKTTVEWKPDCEAGLDNAVKVTSTFKDDHTNAELAYAVLGILALPPDRPPLPRIVRLLESNWILDQKNDLETAWTLTYTPHSTVVATPPGVTVV